MKKLITLISAVLFAVGSAMPSLANNTRIYHINEAKTEFNIPMDWIVFVPLVSDENENLERYGMTGKEFNKMLKKNDIVLNAVHDVQRLGLTVNVTDENDSSITNLKKSSDEQKENVFKAHASRDESAVGKAFPELKLENGKGKIDITGHTVFKTTNADFLTLRGSIDSPEGKSDVYQAVTVLNGKNTVFTLYGIGVNLSDDEIQILNDVMNSVNPNADGGGNVWLIVAVFAVLILTILIVGIIFYKKKNPKYAGDHSKKFLKI